MTRIPVLEPLLPKAERLLPYLQRIDHARWYTNFGPLVRECERRLAENFQVNPEHIVTLGNGTLALTLALRARTEKQSSGYCLMPSWTFAASAHAVVWAGLTPYFVDVDPVTWSLQPDTVTSAIRKLGISKCAAVMPVSVFGAPVATNVWDEFSREFGLPVVIDGAGAFDTSIAGQSPVMISLHATKALGCGEGALLMTKDSGLSAKLRKMTTFGFNRERESMISATNAKMTEYAAAICLCALEDWPTAKLELQRLKNGYISRLSDLNDVLEFSPGAKDDWITSTFSVAFRRASALDVADRLAKSEIESRSWWGTGCHRQTAFRDFPREELPVTESLAHRVLGLPFSRGLTADELDRVASAMRKIVSTP